MVKRGLSHQYREMRLASSSPEEIVLMLYDGAIRFLKDAAREMADKNITAKVRLVEKVEKIVDYLQSCLDMKRGGEIASNLNRLYTYVLMRLTEANFYNDVARIEEIIMLLGLLREGWFSVCDAGKKGEEAGTMDPEKDKATPKNITVHV